MARPRKTGVDYFPLDVDFDDAVECIAIKHGAQGGWAYIRIIQAMYRKGSPVLDLGDPLTLIRLSEQCRCSAEQLVEIAASCVDLKLLTVETVDGKDCLFSRGVEKRLTEIQKQRKGWRKDDHLSVAKSTEDQGKEVIQTFPESSLKGKPRLSKEKTGVIQRENATDALLSFSLHKKDLDLEEGSGGSGGNEPSTELAVVPDGRTLRGKFVSLSDAEFDKLEKHRIATTQTHCSAREFVEIAIERVDVSFGSTPKRRKESRTQDHYLCIVRWGFDAALEHLTRIARSNRESSYAKKAAGSEFPRHIQQSINYTDALLAEARRQDAEDEKRKKLMVN